MPVGGQRLFEIELGEARTNGNSIGGGDWRIAELGLLLHHRIVLTSLN